MLFSPKFYRCELCGQIVSVINDAGGHMTCCGKPMILLEANTSDGAVEKHVPVAEKNGNAIKVKVGSVAHPMTEEHYIEWIYLFLENGGQRHIFKPGDAPEAIFNVESGKSLAAYAYCNLHGLWKLEL